MKTKITAHRGYNEKYPENTLIAFEKAFETGADRIELDVHFTRDKQIVVHHGYLLGQTNNGEGIIFQQKAAYLSSLDAGSWFSKKFSNQRIPLLKEVFNLLKDNIEYEIEIKHGPNLNEFINGLLDLADEFNLIHQIEFTSFSLVALNKIKANNPASKIGMFVPDFSQWLPVEVGQSITKEELLIGGINIGHFPIKVLDMNYVQDLQNQGIKVHAANVDTPEDLEFAYSLKVNQLSTNKLGLALTLRER